MRVPHVAPTAFGHHGLFGRGERYPLELARALALVDGVRCELVTSGGRRVSRSTTGCGFTFCARWATSAASRRTRSHPSRRATNWF